MIRDTSAQDRFLERRPVRNRWLAMGGVAAAAVALAAAAPSIGRLLSATASVSASRLSFATVERGPFVRDIAADGRVVAAVSPTLYAPSLGTVMLKVHAGDAVTRGQVLAVIDSPELTSQLAQEKAALAASKVDYERAQIDARRQRFELQKAYDDARIDAKAAARELARNQEAFKSGALPQREVSSAQDTLAKAKLALQHAEGDLKLDGSGFDLDVEAKKLARDQEMLRVEDLQRRVADLDVRSPVDGQVGQLFVAPRAAVAKDAALLTVVDLSALEVEVEVPEGFARDLGVGMPAEVTGSGGSWSGKVSAISPEVVDAQVAARVRLEGSRPKKLRQNQRLSVRILLDRRDGVLTVARGSFVEQAGGRYAYVVHGGVAVRTPIRLGASAIDKVEVLQGLTAGERIVIAGAENFRGAARVAISR